MINNIAIISFKSPKIHSFQLSTNGRSFAGVPLDYLHAVEASMVFLCITSTSISSNMISLNNKVFQIKLSYHFILFCFETNENVSSNFNCVFFKKKQNLQYYNG